MNKEAPHSYNSRVTPSLRRFLLPSALDIALYLFMSLLALLLLNANAIWHYFSSNNLAGQSLGAVIGQNAQSFQNLFSRISQGRVLQVIFWALVGIFIYIMVWFVRNIMLNVRNDIVADEYVHPLSYKRSNYWHSVIGRKIFFGISVIVLIAYLITCVRLLPLLGKLCQGAVQDFSWSPSVVELAGSWLAVAFLMYLLILIGRVSLIVWKLIYLDL